MTIVYQVLANNYTPRQAADEFARKCFDKPRQVDRFECELGQYHFMLVDGVAEYQVIYVPEVRLVSAALWKIVRLDKS